MKQNFARLGGAVVIGLIASVMLALQAASSVTERSAPEFAISLNPANGMAAEQAAHSRFSDASSDGATPDPARVAKAAAQARSLALASYASEPLTPKSLTVIALATTDLDLRGQILDFATRLNRRDLALQLAALDFSVQNDRAIAAINTLDQLLRVHPQYSDQFFPSLQQAMLVPETEATFAKLLDGSSPWHHAFAMFTVRDAASRLRLARLRSRISITDERFDGQLISGLAEQGELETAAQVYRQVTKSDDRLRDGATILSWRGEYPPFDWQFLDRKEIRAKPGPSGDRLEIFIRPGQGGIIASRIIRLPEGASGKLSFKLDSTRPIIPGRVRMSLFCGTEKELVIVTELKSGDNSISFTPNKVTCAALRVEIYARAYRGEPVFRARIGKMQLS